MASFSPPMPRPFFAIPPRMRVTASAAGRPPGASDDMYEVLSVEGSAGPKEIKAAYRRAARRWHPDACRAAVDEDYFAEQFMRVREAYEVLSDPGLRRAYDHALLRRAVYGRRAGDGGFGDCARQSEGLRQRRRDDRLQWMRDDDFFEMDFDDYMD